MGGGVINGCGGNYLGKQGQDRCPESSKDIERPDRRDNQDA